MTFDEFKAFIAPLALHHGAKKDPPTWRLYHAALMADPAPSRALLDAALLRAANRRFFPTTEELRADAEAERQAFLKQHPYRRCEACLEHAGFVEVLIDGRPRLTRCDCWLRYRESLEALGVAGQPLALPPALETRGGLE